jgi:hypothetical protein
MSDTTTLTVKLTPALKTKIKELSETEQLNLSQLTEKLLWQAIDNTVAENTSDKSAVETDSQDTTEKSESPLTHKEIKAIRKLLRKK